MKQDSAIGVGIACFLAACATSSPADEPASSHGHSAGGENTDEDAQRRRDFSNAELYAQRFDNPERDQWQRPDEVVAAMTIETGMRIVDLGAGTGYFLGRLSAAVGDDGRVLALDIEPQMVAYMQDRIEREGLSNVEARVVSESDPELEDGSVDRILIVNTWHHIVDRSAYARRLTRALRAGGLVIIVDFTEDSPNGPPPAIRLRADQVIGELSAAGLRAATVDEALPRHYIVVGRPPE